jgi:hypothetical protein
MAIARHIYLGLFMILYSKEQKYCYRHRSWHRHILNEPSYTHCNISKSLMFVSLPSLMQLRFSWFLWPFPHPVHRIGQCFPNITNYIKVSTSLKPLKRYLKRIKIKIQCYMFRSYWIILRQRILLERISIALLRVFPVDCYQHVIFRSVFANQHKTHTVERVTHPQQHREPTNPQPLKK